MTLATVDERGRPAARIVLLKEIDDRGCTFFTSYKSREAKDLAARPASSTPSRRYHAGAPPGSPCLGAADPRAGSPARATTGHDPTGRRR
jgi:hypothetical protein